MPSRRTKKKQIAKEIYIPTEEEMEAIKAEIRKEWVKAPSADKAYTYKGHVRVVRAGN